MKPEFLKVSIQAEILWRQGKFEQAIAELGKAQNDEHRAGQILEIYVNWANSRPTVEERIGIARMGLSLPVDDVISRNVPALITRSKLAILADDKKLFDKIVKMIYSLNANVVLLNPPWEDSEQE